LLITKVDVQDEIGAGEYETLSQNEGVGGNVVEHVPYLISDRFPEHLDACDLDHRDQTVD